MTVSISQPVDRRTLLRGSITLAGAAVALPGFAALGGCSSAPASLEGKMELLSALADRIIPETDTPGALAAKVPSYIAAVFDKHLTEEQQSEFAQGLDVFDSMASERGFSSFSKSPADEQDAILSLLDEAGSEESGKAIFQHIRDLTIFGFYTSEIATQELAYEEIPGRYTGCMPLAEVGSAWLERGA